MSEHIYKNWYVLEESGFSTVSYGNRTCFKLSPKITSNTPYDNYFYTNFLYPNQVGNSVSINTNVLTPTISTMAIFDGEYSVIASIGNNMITIGSDSFSYDTSVFSNYTLDLTGTTYKFYINDELVLSGTATPSLDLPIIYYGLINPSTVLDTAYVYYLKSGRSIKETYRVGNWYLNDIRGYSVVTYEGVTCAELNAVLGNNNVLADFFYTDEVSNSTIGNSVSADIAFNPETIMLVDSDNYMYADDEDVFFTASNKAVSQLCIADGSYMVVANIGNGQVVIGSNEYTLSTTHFHNYWLTLKDGKYQMFVDKELILEGDAIPTVSRRIAFGFMDTPSAGDSVYIKYLKNIKEYKRPLDLSKMSFELQVDTTDTFDSVNLKTYYAIDNLVFARQDGSNKAFIEVNEDNNNEERYISITLDGISGNQVFINANEKASVIANAICSEGVPYGWTAILNKTKITLVKDDPEPIQHATQEYNYLNVSGVSPLNITFDLFHRGTALGEGIVRSFTIPLLPRQDMKNICYFFRVRIDNEYYTSGNPNLDESWAYYYFDEPAIDILFTKKDTMKQIQYKVDKMVAFCYEGRQSYMLIENPGPSDFREGYIQIKDSEAIWKPISSSYFLLDPNMSSYYFDSIYNYRMPDEEVYTKYDKSGNIANAIDSETVLLDMVAFEIKNSSRDLDVHLCRDSYLYNNFGKQYSLASEYFNTINEFRNTLLMVINDYCEPGNTYKLQEILASITGVMPRIEEFKHKKKWVIWDSATSLIKPDNEKYILFNPNLPYSNKNKAVLQTAEGKAFTFNIHLYNPLGLSINPDLINVIVSSFKPVFSQANIIFYTQDGMPYTYPAEYYFSSFGQGLYYREDTQENN